MFTKKLCYVVLAAVACSLSCKKGSIVPVDNGCIDRVTRDYSDPNKAELAAGAKLLQDAHISANNLVISRVTLDDTITTNGPVHVFQHVFAQQYANGLPILFAQVAYHFNSKVYDSTSGYLYGKISLGSTPHTSLATLRYLFVDAAKKDSYSVTQNIPDSCLVAEFGYYDTNTSNHNKIIKAWRVTPKNSTYPEAIISDDDSKLLSYFNGLMTAQN
jgi:hypothetical protein